MTLSKKEIWQGNEALAEAAVRAGCTFFAGYPITPQTEIVEYLSRRLPEVGGTYIQSESEVAAINMVIGASIGGVRAMTASSNPGIALMTEGFGALASGRFPCVIVDVQRAGAANVGIAASQSDYNLLTKTFGPGGLRALVFGPGDVQELVNLMGHAFDAADRYRTPVVILTESVVGQMMEPVIFDDVIPDKHYDKSDFVPSGKGKGKRYNVQDSPIITAGSDPYAVQRSAQKLYREYEAMYKQWEEDELMVEEYLLDDAEYAFVAWGAAARITLDAIHNLRADGIKAGMLRPITLFPFPHKQIAAMSPSQFKGVMSVEMAIPAQLYEDVRGDLDRSIPLACYNTGAGMITNAVEVEQRFRETFL